MLTRQWWRRTIVPGALAATSLAGASLAGAQTTLESVIKQYSKETVTGYVQPLADVLAANLNIGYFHTAKVPTGFSFGIDLVGVGSVVGDAQKTYTAHTPTGFAPATFQTATIFGGQGTTVNSTTVPGLQYRGSDGFIIADYFPSAVPQLHVGGILGTEGYLRYFTSSVISGLNKQDFPELKLIGYGVRHSVSQYFKGLPIDIAVSGLYNSLTWGDIVNMKSTAIGGQVGKTFSVLSLYGGLQSESGSMTLSYTSTDPRAPGSVSVDLDVKRQLRYTAGTALKLGFLQFFGDAGFGTVTTYSGGLRIGL